MTDALYVNGERLCDAEPYDQTFVNQAQAFLDCLDGTGKPLSTLEDSEHTLQIIRAAYRSSAEGRVYRTKVTNIKSNVYSLKAAAKADEESSVERQLFC